MACGEQVSEVLFISRVGVHKAEIKEPSKRPEKSKSRDKASQMAR